MGRLNWGGTSVALGCFVVVAGCAVDASAADVKAPVYKAAAAPLSLWAVEVGARYWYSSGRTKFDYHTGSEQSSPVVSRLDYNDMGAHTGETFFRFDSPTKIFVKGYLGLGSTVNGRMYDEDFPPYFNGPYTKTVSNTKGDLSYASVDFGYTLYDGRSDSAAPAVRFGGFVGYHYWREAIDAHGCVQIGGGDVCAGANAIASSRVVITEKDNYNSFRAGGVADVWISPALKFTAEAAYIYAHQSGSDTHHFTFGMAPDHGHGHGVQLEGVLSYAVSSQFSVGLGGRWWYLNSETTDSLFNQALTYKVERVGGFVQSSYRF